MSNAPEAGHAVTNAFAKQPLPLLPFRISPITAPKQWLRRLKPTTAAKRARRQPNLRLQNDCRATRSPPAAPLFFRFPCSIGQGQSERCGGSRSSRNLILILRPATSPYPPPRWRRKSEKPTLRFGAPRTRGVPSENLGGQNFNSWTQNQQIGLINNPLLLSIVISIS